MKLECGCDGCDLGIINALLSGDMVAFWDEVWCLLVDLLRGLLGME